MIWGDFMRGGFPLRLAVLLCGVLLVNLAHAQERRPILPAPILGEFVRPESPVWLSRRPEVFAERFSAPGVAAGKLVRMTTATPNYRWYWVELSDWETGLRYEGWMESSHFRIRGRETEVGFLLDAERGEVESRQAREAEAAREARKAAQAAAEAERQRRQAEAAAQADAEQEQRRLAMERLRAETEARRQAEAREREQARRDAEARRQAEAERARLERAALARQFRAYRLAGWLFLVYGAFLLLPFFRLYRDILDQRGPQSLWSFPKFPLFILSGLGFSGAVWIREAGQLSERPELFLALGFFGLYFWFFVPGLLVFLLVFLHSLFVPHPMEATFKRVLRGERISREEAAKMAQAMYNARRDGIPVDWRVKSQIWRLERLTHLMGKEKAFMDAAIHHILNP